MKKKTKAIKKKKNVADATLRNVRAQNKRMKDIEARLEQLEKLHGIGTEKNDHWVDAARSLTPPEKPVSVAMTEADQLEVAHYPRNWGVSIPLEKMDTITLEEKTAIVADRKARFDAECAAFHELVNSEKKKTTRRKKKK